MEMDFNSPAPQSSVKGKSTPSLRRSCEACRASKGRCCPSQNNLSVCQRCDRDGKECIFLESKPRPKKIRTSRVRVAEMEQRLDGILALLSAGNNTTSIKESSLTHLSYPTPSIDDYRNNSTLVPQPCFATNNVQSPPLMSPTWSSWLKFDEPDDAIGKGIITHDKAEDLLKIYATRTSNFPFIVLSPTVSLDSLRREKPFLLLSILTMTCTENLPLQDLLETELRDNLGRRVIFNGEKSLDLLQGLLIYLAWYHLFYRPDRQQMYQLSQMVIAMAVELEISCSSYDLTGNRSQLSFGNAQARGMRAHRVPPELEAMRTFLGCYHLSSCLSLAFRKPNNLKYTDYVDTCCQALSDAKETPSDRLLPYFIRLQRLAEEINTAFDYGGYQQLPALDAVRTETLLKSFRTQLKHFDESFPLDVWQNVAIRMAFLHVHIYINEIGLYAIRPEPVQSVAAAQASCREWYFSMARTETLVTCVESAQEYIRAFLELPKEDVFQNTIMEEINLVYTVLIVGRFTSGVDSPFIDASHFRETAQFGYYMSALIERLNNVINFNRKGQEGMNYYWFCRRILQHTKLYYDEQIKRGIFTTLETSGLPDCNDMTFMEALEMQQPIPPDDGLPLQSLEGAGAAENELWTVAMLKAWPGSTLDPRAVPFNGGLQ